MDEHLPRALNEENIERAFEDIIQASETFYQQIKSFDGKVESCKRLTEADDCGNEYDIQDAEDEFNKLKQAKENLTRLCVDHREQKFICSEFQRREHRLNTLKQKLQTFRGNESKNIHEKLIQDQRESYNTIKAHSNEAEHQTDKEGQNENEHASDVDSHSHDCDTVTEDDERPTGKHTLSIADYPEPDYPHPDRAHKVHSKEADTHQETSIQQEDNAGCGGIFSRPTYGNIPKYVDHHTSVLKNDNDEIGHEQLGDNSETQKNQQILCAIVEKDTLSGQSNWCHVDDDVSEQSSINSKADSASIQSKDQQYRDNIPIPLSVCNNVPDASDSEQDDDFLCNEGVRRSSRFESDDKPRQYLRDTRRYYGTRPPVDDVDSAEPRELQRETSLKGGALVFLKQISVILLSSILAVIVMMYCFLLGVFFLQPTLRYVDGPPPI